MADTSPKPRASKKVDPTPAPASVTYESRQKEPYAFEVAGIKPTRDFTDGRLIWTVPADDLERFEKHHHVVNNRIRRVAE